MTPTQAHRDDRVTTDEIKQAFVRARVEGKPLNLKELAERYGRSHHALRQAASRGGWTTLATLACAERDGAVVEKMKQQNTLTASLLEQSVEREVDVRRRHAQLARVLQGAALQRLMAIEPGELTAKLAIEMFKVGIEAERSALGLGDQAPIWEQEARDDSALREAVQVATDILTKHAPRLINSSHEPPPQEADQEEIDESGFHCNQLQ